MCLGRFHRDNDIIKPIFSGLPGEFFLADEELEEADVELEEADEGLEEADEELEEADDGLEEAEEEGYVARVERYEETLAEQPNNYTLWNEFLSFVIEEEHADHQEICELFEEALENVPSGNEKIIWETYIKVWMHFADYKELIDTNQRARDVYIHCITIIPRQLLTTLPIIWLAFARFEHRGGHLEKAQAILDEALEVCPSREIYQAYIDMEFE